MRYTVSKTECGEIEEEDQTREGFSMAYSVRTLSSHLFFYHHVHTIRSQRLHNQGQ